MSLSVTVMEGAGREGERRDGGASICTKALSNGTFSLLSIVFHSVIAMDGGGRCGEMSVFGLYV